MLLGCWTVHQCWHGKCPCRGTCKSSWWKSFWVRQKGSWKVACYYELRWNGLHRCLRSQSGWQWAQRCCFCVYFGCNSHSTVSSTHKLCQQWDWVEVSRKADSNAEQRKQVSSSRSAHHKGQVDQTRSQSLVVSAVIRIKQAYAPQIGPRWDWWVRFDGKYEVDGSQHAPNTRSQPQ